MEISGLQPVDQSTVGLNTQLMAGVVSEVRGLCP